MLPVEKALLIRIAGADATDADGAVTVNDATLGNITITVAPASSALLVPGTYVYDVQDLIGTTITTRTSGTFIVVADTTRAVS